MNEEEKIQQELLKNFAFLEGKVKIQRARRIFVEVPLEKFFDVFDYAVKNLGVSMLSALTGLDDGEALSFIYHLAFANGIILNFKTGVAKHAPLLKTVTGYFPSAEIYERELVDLLGVEVVGLKKGKRYPLPDNWPQGQYPLRKGWKKEALNKQEDKKDA
jgi:membrane-bound hydrogenase subunit beta